MPDFRPDFGSVLPDPPALDEVARTDLLLDALADRQQVDLDDSCDPNDRALAALLADWRDDLRWPPASALVSQEEAVDAWRAGLVDRRRARRGVATIGSVAATLLLLSGFGAVVAEARPGDALYGLHAMFFDEARVNDDQIVLSAKADLAKVQQMIDQGEWARAHDQLAEVSSSLQSVNDDSRRQDLLDQINLLNTRVRTHDPNATPAPRSQPPATTAVTTPATTRPASTGPGATSPTTIPSSPSLPSSPALSTPVPSSTETSTSATTRTHHHGRTPTPSTTTPSPAPSGPASGSVVSAPVPAP